MSSLRTCLVLAALVPSAAACITEGELDDVETSDVEQEATRGIATQLITFGNRVIMYDTTTYIWIRLVDHNGSPMAGRNLTAKIGTRSYYVLTNGDGFAVLEDDFSELGPPKQHTVTWSFAGGGIYAPATTTTQLTVVKGDCTVRNFTSSYDAATNKQSVGVEVVRRNGGMSAPSPISGAEVEFSRNGVVLGTAPQVVGAEGGAATLTLTPVAYSGTVWAQFLGNEYFAPCATSGEYALVEPLGVISVKGNRTSATIGSSTLSLTVRATQLSGGSFVGRPNTKVLVYARTPETSASLLGEVTTDAYGWAYLTVPVTAVGTSGHFYRGQNHIFGYTPAALNYEQLSANSGHYINVARGNVAITATDKSDEVDGWVTAKFSARNLDVNTQIANLLLRTPCGKMFTDATGKTAFCTFPSWHLSSYWTYYYGYQIWAMPTDSWFTDGIPAWMQP